MKLSISAMKLQQDRANNPPSPSEIDTYCRIIASLGSQYIDISVPYDFPGGGADVIAQNAAWIQSARAHGLKVFHRQSFCDQEGWYGVAKNTSHDHLADVTAYIVAHPEFYKEGDIFCPKPEPQNMGIQGVNTGSSAQFSSVAAFNTWLRDSMTAAQKGFDQIGLKNIEIGYFGFDGFITCGYGNPDWQGKSFLERETVAAMGNLIAVDHYPSASGKPMSDFIQVFSQTWPGTQLFLGEFGTTGSSDTSLQFTETWNALQDPIVTGMNYWQLGPDGQSEKLINSDLSLTNVAHTLQKLWGGNSIPVPTPTPTPVPTPTPDPIPTPTPTPVPIPGPSANWILPKFTLEAVSDGKGQITIQFK